MKRTHSIALTVILAAAIYSMWSLSVFAAAAPTKIVIGFAAMNAGVAPLWITEEQGILAKSPLAPLFQRGVTENFLRR